MTTTISRNADPVFSTEYFSLVCESTHRDGYDCIVRSTVTGRPRFVVELRCPVEGNRILGTYERRSYATERKARRAYADRSIV